VSIRAERSEIWLLGGFGLLTILTGLLAGVDGRLAIMGALVIAFAMAALADLTLGLALVTFIGFVIVVPNLAGATLDIVKLAPVIPLLFSWLALVTRQEGQERTFVAAHPAMAMVIFLFVAWASLSVLWAESGDEVMKSVYRYVLAVLLLLIVYTAVQKQRDVMLIMGAIVAGAACAAAYGLVNPPTEPGLADRVSGTLGDPNELAAAMVLGIGLSGGLIAVAKSPFIRLPLLGAAALCLITLILTGSRGGVLALAAMLIAAVLLTKGKRLALTLVTLAVALAGIGYLATAAPEDTRERILHPGRGSGRIDIWTVGGRMVSANPVLGVGTGNFSVASIHYLLQPGSLPDDQFIADTPQVAHNMYLEVLAELGFPGAILFLTIIVFGLGCSIAALSKFRAQGHAQMQALTTSVAISLIGALAADVFLSGEYAQTLWLLVGLGPALLAIAKRMESGPAAS
jgi:O-antigen ligase